VCAFYALFAIIILTMWRTASWIGVDGLIAGYRQRRHDQPRYVFLPGEGDATGTAAAVKTAA
jgi:hypothetical protein